jgi:hypothetical protein
MTMGLKYLRSLNLRGNGSSRNYRFSGAVLDYQDILQRSTRLKYRQVILFYLSIPLRVRFIRLLPGLYPKGAILTHTLAPSCPLFPFPDTYPYLAFEGKFKPLPVLKIKGGLLLITYP